MKDIWIFNGNDGALPAGAFDSKEKAEVFIEKYNLSGCLTKYPVNLSLYDWTIENEYFEPKKDSQKSSKFIETFTSAYTEHYHYENGGLY